MAHELSFNADGTAQMLYKGGTPWHGLGTKITEDVSSAEALEMCKADYQVYTGKLYTEMHEPVDAQYVYRMNGEKKVVLAPHVGVDYTPLQNKEAFSWFDPFLEEGLASIETAGVLRDGARVWILCAINKDPVDITKGDAVKKYLVLSNAHDGIQAARAGFTPIRIVCANTLAMAIGDAGSCLLRVRHTKNISAALLEVRKTIDLANEEFNTTAANYRLMLKYGVNDEDMKKYVRRVFATPEQDEAILAEEKTTAGARIWKSIEPLIQAGKGTDIPGVRGTLYGAYNAVTEYLSWLRGKDAGIRLESNWWGNSMALNKRAYTLAMNALKKGALVE